MTKKILLNLHFKQSLNEHQRMHFQVVQLLWKLVDKLIEIKIVALAQYMSCLIKIKKTSQR